MQVAQGRVVKGVKQGGGHLAAAPYKQGAFRIRSVRSGGKAVGHQHMAGVRREQGYKPLQQGLQAGPLSPQAVVPQKLPGLGGVKVGEQEQLQLFLPLFQHHWGEGVRQLCGKVNTALPQGPLEQGHPLGPVVVAGNNAHLGPQGHQPGQGAVEKLEGFHRGNLPVVDIPGQQDAGGLFPLHRRQEHLLQKPLLVL